MTRVAALLVLLFVVLSLLSVGRREDPMNLCGTECPRETK